MNVVDLHPMPRRLLLTQETWDATPVVIRSEIIRMVDELTAGIVKYGAAAKRDAELKEFHELAVRQGTTVAAALRRFVDMETLIKEDPLAGVFKICENMGLDPIGVLRQLAAAPHEDAA